MNYGKDGEYSMEKGFKQIITDMFNASGYKTSLKKNGKYDISASMGETTLAIDIKTSRNKDVSQAMIHKAAESIASSVPHYSANIIKPVVIVNGVVSDSIRSKIKKNPKTNNVIILDIQNLKYLVSEDEQLSQALAANLIFSIDDVDSLSPTEELNISPKISNSTPNPNGFIKELAKWKNFGKENSAAYEKLCSDVLLFLFADDLCLWKKQKSSGAGLFRFDLICKIKDGVDKEFWKIAEKYFNSKYIIFEYKNYMSRISQKEIFTTEKYLYAKALRNIAILISVEGEDRNAQKAIRGILRENGKLILSLTNNDLIKMIKLKLDNANPADYLSQKLDDLLIDLEK